MLDQPWLAQVMPASKLVAGGGDPALVARVLDLPLASELIASEVIGDASIGDASIGDAAAVGRVFDSGSRGSAAVVGDRIARAAAVVGLRQADRQIVDLQIVDLQITVAPELSVAVAGADPVPVRWWYRDGRWWVDGSADAIGRALAWAAGAWPDRHRAVAAAGEDWLALAEDALA